MTSTLDTATRQGCELSESGLRELDLTRLLDHAADISAVLVEAEIELVETLSVTLRRSPAATAALVADALDLHHRLPEVWGQVQAGRTAVAAARRICAATRDLTGEAAAWVDRQLRGRVGGLGPAELARVIALAIARVDGDAQADRERRARDSWDVTLRHPDPTASTGTLTLTAVGDTLDLTRFHDAVCAHAETLGALGDKDTWKRRKAKSLGVIADQQLSLDLIASGEESAAPAHDPDVERARARALARRAGKIRLYLHATLADLLNFDDSDASVGFAETLGPVTLAQIRSWCGRGRVTIQPVLHVPDGDPEWAVDAHDPPPRMADQVRLRDKTCRFPWCTRPARASDLDHVEPYRTPDDGGPPGQTTAANLAPLCRRHHRAKTSERWTYTRTGPGEYLWTGPHGVTAFVGRAGTLRL